MNARGQLHPPHAPIIEILMNLWKARALYAAARLAVPDLVAAGRHTVEDLAQATQTHAPSLHRLLRALAGCGFLAETEPGYFALTPLGDALRTDAPGAAHATVLTLAGDWQWKAWDHFIYSLRTGEPAMLQAFGKTLFEYLVESPQDSARFNEAMIGMHGRDGSAIVEVIDFSTFRTLADLGGGTGTLLTTVLSAHEHLRGLLLELPETIPHARRLVAERGLTDRCELRAGDFFHEVPPGHDGYILAHVLHDWTDAQASVILRNCRRAIPQHGRLLIAEAVVPAGDTPHPVKLMDLLMLTVTGGVERTAEQFSALLEAGGFRLRRVVRTSIDLEIIEAVPA
ncbi:MAG TPA: methyltransferase [Burkholderiales bacterium]|nr:methyltransferase [Burkholderiales bacterium]